MVLLFLCYQFKDFTTDPVNYPSTSMSQFINELHMNGQRYGRVCMFVCVHVCVCNMCVHVHGRVWEEVDG